MSSQMESIRRALRVHGARSSIPVVVQKVNLSLFLIRSVNPLFFYFIWDITFASPDLSTSSMAGFKLTMLI